MKSLNKLIKGKRPKPENVSKRHTKSPNLLMSCKMNQDPLFWIINEFTLKYDSYKKMHCEGMKRMQKKPTMKRFPMFSSESIHG